MITLKHIEIYEKYHGDGDDFVRSSNQEKKLIMDYKHWSLIDNLIQDLLLLEKGPASSNFAKSVDERLKESCDILETIQALRAIALKND